MRINETIIFWDWNGTLLDDATTCLETMNRMLNKRCIPEITLDLYKEVFGFPVINYYKKIGFDFTKESFESLSVEFIEGYHKVLSSAPLIQDGEEVLKAFNEKGKKNIIISAMQQDMLIESVKYKGLTDYFTDILGLDNIYAASKSQMALNYVRDAKLNIRDILFIGDTEHDFEVAQEIGCKSLLIADGHQSEARLRATGVEVIPSLKWLLKANVPKSL